MFLWLMCEGVGHFFPSLFCSKALWTFAYGGRERSFALGSKFVNIRAESEVHAHASWKSCASAKDQKLGPNFGHVVRESCQRRAWKVEEARLIYAPPATYLYRSSLCFVAGIGNAMTFDWRKYLNGHVWYKLPSFRIHPYKLNGIKLSSLWMLTAPNGGNKNVIILP